MREEEKNQSSPKLNKFFKKRWVYPSLYLVAGALLITAVIWFQMRPADLAETPDKGKELAGEQEQPVVEVNQTFENVAMPVKNESEARIITEFFDVNASADKQEAALIVDGNKYMPNMGVDIAMNEGGDFDVTASLSGKVADVRKDPLLGDVIEISHENGIMTVYQSIKDIQVKVGDSVKQGDVLAKAGTSQLNSDAKTHLHFEIRKDQVALNPHDFFGQPATAIEEYEANAEAEEKAEQASDDKEDSMDTMEEKEEEAAN